MKMLLLYLLFLRATALSFSGFASVPLVHQDLVERAGVLTDQQLNGSIAISQTSPGPLGMYIVAVGYFVAGVPGALCGLLALCTPAFLVILIQRLFRLGKDDFVRRASAGIVISSSMLLLVTAARMSVEVLPSAMLILIAVFSFALLITNTVKPVFVVAGGAIIMLLTLVR